MGLLKSPSWFPAWLIILTVSATAASGQESAADLSKPVRVADIQSVERVFPGPSHAHPGICVSQRGTVVVVHYVENAGLVLISRSTDGGRNWSKSTPVADVNCKCYPGALTALKDGRLLVTWNCWSKDLATRCPQFSLSKDDGLTWSKPETLPLTDPTNRSSCRHAILELSPREWVFSLMDRTMVYHPDTGKATPFGDGSRRGYGEAMVRTSKGTLLTGGGLRSTDGAKTWEQVKPFPRCGNYHNDLIALANGLVVATDAGKSLTSMRLIVSRDDGKTWDFDHPCVFYDPGRKYGNGSPHLAQLDANTLAIVFMESDRAVPGGPGIFFLRLPLAKLRMQHAP